MKKRRRRRKRRLHITPRGYIVISVFVLLIVLIILLSIAIGMYRKEVKAERAAATPSPAIDAALPDAPADAPQGAVPVAPESTSAPAQTPAPELASTGSRLPTADEEAGAVDGIIRTSDVALRKGPGKEYDKIYKYQVGEYVKVYAEENGYTFVQVLSDKRFGFLSSDFVVKFGPIGSDAAATPVPAAPASAVMGLVNVDELKLRPKPSTKGNEPLQICKSGDLLWVFFQTDDFYYVQCAASGAKGYVFAEYVMVSAPAPTGSPVP